MEFYQEKTVADVFHHGDPFSQNSDTVHNSWINEVKKNDVNLEENFILEAFQMNEKQQFPIFFSNDIQTTMQNISNKIYWDAIRLRTLSKGRILLEKVKNTHNTADCVKLIREWMKENGFTLDRLIVLYVTQFILAMNCQNLRNKTLWKRCVIFTILK